MTFSYVGSVINLGNSFSQATRPKNVGQMSDRYKSTESQQINQQETDGNLSTMTESDLIRLILQLTRLGIMCKELKES